MKKDLIIGLHSVQAAIENKNRSGKVLYATHESLKEFQKKSGLNLKETSTEVILTKSHALQEEAKKHYADLGFTYSRVPSNVFLIADEFEAVDLSWLYERLKSGPLKILCLDQVSDVHNGAAILRSAAFFGVEAVLVSQKGSFGTGPSFHRLASGASEFIPIVKCSSLPQALTKLKERDVLCVGLSEHSSENLESILETGLKDRARCLVLGAEDVGLSHAVSRVLDTTLSLESKGAIKSLNVSVAAALAMSRVF